MRAPLLKWKIEKTQQETAVYLEGIVNEEFAYRDLATELRGRETIPLKLNLKEVRRINSMGIREWFNFLKELSWPQNIILCDCSLIFTEVLSQIEELGHGCIVDSCYLPIWCENCEEEFPVRMSLNLPLAQQPREIACPECSSMCPIETWSLDDIFTKQTKRNAS